MPFTNGKTQASRCSNVLVIGLGNIGAGNSPALDKNTVSHSSAIIKNSSFRLIAGIDISEKQRRGFQEVFNTPAYPSIQDYLSKRQDKIEVVVISTPTINHLVTIEEVINQVSPRIIICEKPMGLNHEETMKIIETCKNNSVLCIPGYFRKFCGQVQNIRKRIISGEFGALQESTIFYGQDLLVNGCHFVNLFLFLCGLEQEKMEMIVWDKKNRNNPTFVLRTAQDVVIKVIGTQTDFRRTGGIQLQFERGMISYENGGSRIVVAKTEPRRTWVRDDDEFYELDPSSNIHMQYNEIQKILEFDIIVSKQEAGPTEILTQKIMSMALTDNTDVLQVDWKSI